MATPPLLWAAYNNWFYIEFTNLNAFEISSIKTQLFSLIIVFHLTKTPKTRKSTSAMAADHQVIKLQGWADVPSSAEGHPAQAQLLGTVRLLPKPASHQHTAASGVPVAPKHFLAVVWHETLPRLLAPHTQEWGCIWQGSQAVRGEHGPDAFPQSLETAAAPPAPCSWHGHWDQETPLCTVTSKWQTPCLSIGIALFRKSSALELSFLGNEKPFSPLYKANKEIT